MTTFEDLGYRGPVTTQDEIPRRWLCTSTRACMAAGTLPEPVCPRGDSHETRPVRHLDFTGGRDQEAGS